ncbi:hypothetical protein AVEN_148689-1 [Araneus ventricosus]|uniref:Transmembrane protein n=1 Tax=Araneus ventricosus TaxID=182803 RepID=A0A4Y2BJX5_ARAVE|nr:hypothetical protein AVEN_54319-1 [Araneus ventricosus]GBL92358.1 hypothetical protein AVEN_148689-1 [Araneus ventricosus]
MWWKREKKETKELSEAFPWNSVIWLLTLASIYYVHRRLHAFLWMWWKKKKSRNVRTVISLSVEWRDVVPNTGIHILISSSFVRFLFDVLEKRKKKRNLRSFKNLSEEWCGVIPNQEYL